MPSTLPSCTSDLKRRKYNFAACIKCGLELQGYPVGAPLPPQSSLSSEGIEEIRLTLAKLGAL